MLVLLTLEQALAAAFDKVLEPQGAPPAECCGESVSSVMSQTETMGFVCHKCGTKILSALRAGLIPLTTQQEKEAARSGKQWFVQPGHKKSRTRAGV